MKNIAQKTKDLAVKSFKNKTIQKLIKGTIVGTGLYLGLKAMGAEDDIYQTFNAQDIPEIAKYFCSQWTTKAVGIGASYIPINSVKNGLNKYLLKGVQE